MFTGSEKGLDPEPLWMLEGGQTFGALGTAMAILENRDGSKRFALAAPGRTDQSADGVVFIFELDARGAVLGPVQVFRAEKEGSLFGAALASGDLNGDGWADLAVGAPAFSSSASRVGRVYLFHGGPGGFQPQPQWIAEGAAFDDQSGSSLAADGDVNGDGFHDLALGSPYAFAAHTRAGRADIFYGSADGLAASSDETPFASSTTELTQFASAPVAAWFATCALAVFAAAVISYQRRKARQIKAAAVALIAAEREKIARNLHDDVGGELARVLALSRSAAGSPQTSRNVSPAEVADAAEELKKRALRNDFDALAVIAPPKALGVLRKELHKEVEKRIVLTVNKEMTDRPIPDIEELLVGEAAPPA